MAKKLVGDCWQARYGVGPCQSFVPCDDWRRFREAALNAGYASGYLAASKLGLWNVSYDTAIAALRNSTVTDTEVAYGPRVDCLRKGDGDATPQE